MKMRRLLTFVVALSLSLVPITVASAETFDNPQGNFNWKVYDYNASGQALSSRQPFRVGTTDHGIAFDFLHTPDTALFMTAHPSYRGDLVGDISSKTMISATVGVTVDATAQFTYYGEPDDCGTPANVRFFFQTQSPGPFAFTDYWWSNPVAVTLENLKASDTTITNGFDPSMWSDWNGKNGIENVTAFDAALHNVKAMGLSFGGGCGFENGVGIAPGTGNGYFRLMDFSTSPPSLDDPLATVVPELVLAPFVVPTVISIP
jgi:hypothetical protein